MLFRPGTVPVPVPVPVLLLIIMVCVCDCVCSCYTAAYAVRRFTHSVWSLTSYQRPVRLTAGAVNSVSTVVSAMDRTMYVAVWLCLSVFYQGSHASWQVLDFFLKFSGPAKSWKMTLVLENPGN